MKKIISILILFILSMIHNTNVVFAETWETGAAKITASGPVTAKPDETIEITIKCELTSIGDAIGFSYCNGSLTFDASKMQFINYEYIVGQSNATGETGSWNNGPFAFNLGAPNYAANWLDPLTIKAKFKINNNIANDTTLSFTTKSSMTRVSSSIPNGMGKYWFDVPTNGMTLTVKVINNTPNNTVTTPAPNNETGTTSYTKSNNALLKSIVVEGYKVNETFNKEKYEYNLTIPYEVNELTVNVSLEDSKSSVNTTGNKDLKVGENLIKIEVTAEDGTKKEYIINVNKQEEINTQEVVATNKTDETKETKEKKPANNNTIIIIVTSSALALGGIGSVIYFKKFRKIKF